MTIRFLIMLFTLVTSSGAFSTENSQVVLTFVQFSSENVEVYSAPNGIVAAQPQWVPGEGQVPLLVSKALEVARFRFPDDELTSIRLAKKKHAKQEIWFYIFEFEWQKQVVVLMRGDLVEAETVNEKEFFQKLR